MTTLLFGQKIVRTKTKPDIIVAAFKMHCVESQVFPADLVIFLLS